mgnify:CR=1 FL=1
MTVKHLLLSVMLLLFSISTTYAQDTTTSIQLDENSVTITSAGSYEINGTLSDGQIIVNTEDDGVVNLILNNVTIHSSTNAPIYVMNAEDVVITLPEGTQNFVSDGATYDTEDPNAAIYSESDMTITGGGSLTVEANYNDGIASKDSLTITGGNITVTSVDDGIRGKDDLTISNATITLDVQGDGLKSDNEEDAEKGYIALESSNINITAANDGIQAETSITINSGEFNIVTGGGSNAYLGEDVSAKGIKGAVSVTINGGTFVIDSADDAIHSNDSIVINAGDFLISTGDDGVHADTNLEINNGTFNITQSYEGLESAVITINDGTIYVVSSDDGINVAGGNDGSGMVMGGGGRGGGGMGGGRGGMPGGNTPPDGNTAPGGNTAPAAPDNANGQFTPPDNAGMPSDDWAAGGGFTASGSYYLYINGGYIIVNANGDGLDANGSIEMTGGIVLVSGPTENMNGALDYDGSFTLTGGFFVAVGSSGMAQAPGNTSTQASMLVNFSSNMQPGNLIHIENAQGEDILTFAPIKNYQSISFSSPELTVGETYNIYVGGSSTGTATDNLYQGGDYTPGSLYTSLTLSSVVTRLGGGGGR